MQEPSYGLGISNGLKKAYKVPFKVPFKEITQNQAGENDKEAVNKLPAKAGSSVHENFGRKEQNRQDDIVGSTAIDENNKPQKNTATRTSSLSTSQSNGSQGDREQMKLTISEKGKQRCKPCVTGC